MTSETAEVSGRTPPRDYPQLDSAQTAAINGKLVEVAALRHSGKLTPAQLADLASAIEQQTRHLESLHRFPLTNADEPAFIRSPLRATR